MNLMSMEMICSACGADTLVRCEARYDGFKKTGECFVCVSCGHEYSNASEVPFKVKEKRPAVFTDDDRPVRINIFDESEKRQNCRYCEHYIKNPFTQRCGLNCREVEATGWCDKFHAAKDTRKDNGEKNSNSEIEA